MDLKTGMTPFGGSVGPALYCTVPAPDDRGFARCRSTTTTGSLAFNLYADVTFVANAPAGSYLFAVQADPTFIVTTALTANDNNLILVDLLVVDSGYSGAWVDV